MFILFKNYLIRYKFKTNIISYKKIDIDIDNQCIKLCYVVSQFYLWNVDWIKNILY